MTHPRPHPGSFPTPSPLSFILMALLIPALLAGFALWLGHEYARIDRDRKVLQQTVELNTSALAVLAAMRQAESTQRGYVVTRDPRFLAPYEPARRTVAQQLPRYRDAASAAAVRELIGAKFAEMDQVLAIGRSGEWGAAIARISDGEGLALMGRIERLMMDEVAGKNRELAVGREQFLARTAATQHIVWLLIAIVSVAVLMGMVLLWKYRRERWAAAIEADEALTRHRTILDSSSDAIVILNPSGTIEQVNAAALTLLGYDPAELRRRDVSKILDIAEGEGTFHQRVGVVDDELVTRQLVDRRAFDKNGTAIPVDIALGLMQLPDGLHIVASVRDVSSRKKIERLKDEFVATVSHELRTPLTSVVGSLGLLRAGTAGQLPDTAQELVAIAESNTRRLIRLTNDILDLEKLSSGKMSFEFGDVDLGELAAEAARDHQALAATRNVAIHVVPAPEAQIVAGDRQRLLQVAANLLVNAIRHTREGSTVSIEIVSVDGRAVTRITDEGAGVPIEFRERIFDRFAQAPSAQVGGTGLGLAISREIIARHDGSIWYEESPSGGAVFAFALEKVRAKSLTRCSLLLLSEDAETIARVVEVAATEGFDVVHAGTIEAAEQAAADRRADPSLLVFDADIPLDRQQSLCCELRQRPALMALPITVISNALLDISTTLPIDIVDWIAKPVEREPLTRAIRQAGARNRSGRPLILHIDDDQDLAAMTAAAISDEGDIIHASDLAAARNLLRDRSPDVVLLDLSLPDGSGLELLPELVDAQGHPIPVILHSAEDVSNVVTRQVAATIVKSRASLPDLKLTLRRTLMRRQENGDDR